MKIHKGYKYRLKTTRAHGAQGEAKRLLASLEATGIIAL